MYMVELSSNEVTAFSSVNNVKWLRYLESIINTLSDRLQKCKEREFDPGPFTYIPCGVLAMCACLCVSMFWIKSVLV
jgi:hypothetical protein